MKDFLKNIVATVFGVFLAVGLMIAFLFFSVIGSVLSSSSETKVSGNSVLVLNLQGQINERGGDDILSALTGNEITTIGLDDILCAIEKASLDKNIEGIYIKTGLLSADYATLQEIRAKLMEFKKSKKWIVSYADSYLQGAYYVASAADKVYINPLGRLDWHGIGSQPQYYKDFLEKIGVRFEVVKVGTYKSATEMFTEESMSQANREQISRYIGGIWNNLLKDVSKSRNISIANLNAYADGIMSLQNAKQLKQKGMVDDLLYPDQVKQKIKERLHLSVDDDVNKVTVSDMKSLKVSKGIYSSEGDKIAVYFCEGDIVMYSSSGVTGSSGKEISAKTVCRDLEDLKNDDDIKAVVLRINSGGGDAYASEQLWHYVSELKTVKPVVVSMGGYAASGAYYMSANASWIVAEPMTLTGSIGIFGMFPDISGLMTRKLGIRFDEVKTNENSTFSPVGMARPLNSDEIAYLQQYINEGYAIFRQRVADGRNLSVDKVESMAQGRVWLGQDALGLKLVDQLGTLSDAIVKAASLSKTKEYHIATYPAPLDWGTQLLQKTMNTDDSEIDGKLRAILGDYYEPFMLVRDIRKQSPVQARIPYMLNIR